MTPPAPHVPAWCEGARVGVFGKLPSRGDFIRAGLPRDFVDPWDAWWQRGIAAMRRDREEAWTAAWLEAPVWRFAVPPGLLGSSGVAGVWLPSVDRAGRYFPLTIAAAAPFGWEDRLARLEPFFEGAEQAGRDALEQDSTPDALMASAEAALAACRDIALPNATVPTVPSGTAAWWTEGGVRVAPRVASGSRLPEGHAFAALIDDGWDTPADATSPGATT